LGDLEPFLEETVGGRQGLNGAVVAERRWRCKIVKEDVLGSGDPWYCSGSVGESFCCHRYGHVLKGSEVGGRGMLERGEERGGR